MSSQGAIFLEKWLETAAKRKWAKTLTSPIALSPKKSTHPEFALIGKKWGQVYTIHFFTKARTRLSSMILEQSLDYLPFLRIIVFPLNAPKEYPVRHSPDVFPDFEDIFSTIDN